MTSTYWPLFFKTFCRRWGLAKMIGDWSLTIIYFTKDVVAARSLVGWFMSYYWQTSASLLTLTSMIINLLTIFFAKYPSIDGILLGRVSYIWARLASLLSKWFDRWWLIIKCYCFQLIGWKTLKDSTSKSKRAHRAWSQLT